MNGLKKKLFSYMKDERSSSQTLIEALQSIISCETLNIVVLFEGTCFSHAFNKSCQYAMNDSFFVELLTLLLRRHKHLFSNVSLGQEKWKRVSNVDPSMHC
jgi:hypothetical protein